MYRVLCLTCLMSCAVHNTELEVSEELSANLSSNEIYKISNSLNSVITQKFKSMYFFQCDEPGYQEVLGEAPKNVTEALSGLNYRKEPCVVNVMGAYTPACQYYFVVNKEGDNFTFYDNGVVCN